MAFRRINPLTLLIGIALIGGLIALCLVVLGFVVTLELFPLGEHGTDPGVALATMALALFTGLLFVFGAATAIFAYEEIRASSIANKLSAGANSAALALQMDNRFNSDRALRIRHGAIIFLAKHQKDENGEVKRNLDLECCDAESVSPYATAETNRWNNLPSDLIDLFNYFDWIAYLVIERGETIDLEVVAQKFGPWIISYYQICEKEIEDVLTLYPARWRYLKPLYEKLIQREEEYWDKNSNENSPPYREPVRKHHEIDAFLRREHVRSHRGVNP
jgi:hypothetical protein